VEEKVSGFDAPEETPALPSAVVSALREAQKKRIESLSGLLPAPVFINSVIQPLSLLHPDFIRINGWPGFLGMPLLEAAANEKSEAEARAVFGDQLNIVKDVPGFVTPRILSMIINEAYFTLHARASTRNEIDTAMKLGTGYPLGPFEWAEKIGVHKIVALLMTLGKEEEVYGLAPGMIIDR
jgi:3-hydroxybutyryl-CoA dehydrogenase